MAVTGLPEGEEVRGSLARALQYVTPTIPPAVRLSRSKRLLLRVLRFLWRDQAAFNALLLEAGGGLADRLDAAWNRLRGALDAERDARERQLGQLMEDLTQLEGMIERRVPEWERRAAIQDGRLAILEAGGDAARATVPAPPAGGAAAAPLPPASTSLFEERFRGSPEDDHGETALYLPLLRGLPGPILDVGCGRGELLRLLARGGDPGLGSRDQSDRRFGVPGGGSVRRGGGRRSPALSRPGREPGSGRRAPGRRALERGGDLRFLREARRELAPGGVLIAETINTDSFSSLAGVLPGSLARPARSRRKPCDFWPRRRASRKRASSTWRSWRPETASRRLGQRREVEPAPLRTAGLRARSRASARAEAGHRREPRGSCRELASRFTFTVYRSSDEISASPGPGRAVSLLGGGSGAARPPADGGARRAGGRSGPRDDSAHRAGAIRSRPERARLARPRPVGDRRPAGGRGHRDPFPELRRAPRQQDRLAHPPVPAGLRPVRDALQRLHVLARGPARARGDRRDRPRRA